jgi:hypothetical protein
MKIHFLQTRLLGVCLTTFALVLASSATAAVSDDEFNALKDLVTKQGQRLDQLEKAHQADQEKLQQSQKTHEQDQQQIQKLQQQLDQTQKTADSAQQKAEAAAQVQGPSATHNFMVVGDAEVQFGKTDGSHSAFALADFAPIFLFRAHDNILFEAGFDVRLQNNAPGSSGATTTIDVSFAQLDYLLNDYATLVGGYMLLPLGTYSERAAGWLNKIPDDPLPRGLLPGAGAGAQVRGAVGLGDSGQHLTYAVYGANGPGSVDGTGNHDQLDLGGNVGLKSDGTFGNLHGSPSAGGRVGWFYPWKPHYDLELGLSGQTGPWDNDGNRLWSAGVFDGALHIGPDVEIKGEYIYSWVETDDIGTFKPRGWWIQGGYKLAGLHLELPVVNNLELVGRYDTIQDGLGVHGDRYTFGYVYYLSNTLLFEGDYEVAKSNSDDLSHNRLVFQLSYGF